MKNCKRERVISEMDSEMGKIDSTRTLKPSSVIWFSIPDLYSNCIPFRLIRHQGIGDFPIHSAYNLHPSTPISFTTGKA